MDSFANLNLYHVDYCTTTSYLNFDSSEITRLLLCFSHVELAECQEMSLHSSRKGFTGDSYSDYIV